MDYVRIGEMETLKDICALGPTDIKIIWDGVIPKMPDDCELICGGEASFQLFLMIGKLVAKKGLEPIVRNPRIICELCSPCGLNKNMPKG